MWNSAFFARRKITVIVYASDSIVEKSINYVFECDLIPKSAVGRAVCCEIRPLFAIVLFIVKYSEIFRGIFLVEENITWGDLSMEEFFRSGENFS